MDLFSSGEYYKSKAPPLITRISSNSAYIKHGFGWSCSSAAHDECSTAVGRAIDSRAAQENLPVLLALFQLPIRDLGFWTSKMLLCLPQVPLFIFHFLVARVHTFADASQYYIFLHAECRFWYSMNIQAHWLLERSKTENLMLTTIRLQAQELARQ